MAVEGRRGYWGHMILSREVAGAQRAKDMSLHRRKAGRNREVQRPAGHVGVMKNRTSGAAAGRAARHA